MYTSNWFINKCCVVVVVVREESSRQITDVNAAVYKYGSSVRTKKDTDRGTLVLPQPVLSGQCLNTAPVQFLKNLDHTCTFTLTPAMCSPATTLSTLYYIQSNTVADFFAVLEEYNGINVTVSSVVYKCADAATAQGYLRSTTPVTVDRTRTSNLGLNPACVGVCGADLCEDLTTVDPTPITTPINNCPNQTPSPPTYIGQTCNNAVLDVEYIARWEGSRIVNVEAVIIVGNIPVQSNNVPNVLSQKFKVSFLNNVIKDNATDNFNNVTEPFTRSGRVGYDKGRELFSGSAVYNSSLRPPEFLYTNSNASRQMAVFDTGKILQKLHPVLLICFLFIPINCLYGFMNQTSLLIKNRRGNLKIQTVIILS